jgi:hypothetical protein
VKLCTPKLMKIRCYLRIYVNFEIGFQMKLTVYGSSATLRCVNMIELEFHFCKCEIILYKNLIEAAA